MSSNNNQDFDNQNDDSENYDDNQQDIKEEYDSQDDNSQHNDGDQGNDNENDNDSNVDNDGSNDDQEDDDDDDKNSVGPKYIRLRGLPWSATHKEILDFLKNVNVIGGAEGIHLITSRWDAKNTGEAYVEVKGPQDVETAMKLDNCSMGHRYIEVFNAQPKEALEAMRKTSSHGTSYVVKLRGLPYSVTEQQVEEFFSGLEIKPEREGIIFVMDRRGRATGEAFVQFESQEDTEQALGRNREKIGHRYIEIFRSSLAELRRSTGNGNGRMVPYDLKDRGSNRGGSGSDFVGNNRNRWGNNGGFGVGANNTLGFNNLPNFGNNGHFGNGGGESGSNFGNFGNNGVGGGWGNNGGFGEGANNTLGFNNLPNFGNNGHFGNGGGGGGGNFGNFGNNGGGGGNFGNFGNNSGVNFGNSGGGGGNSGFNRFNGNSGNFGNDFGDFGNFGNNRGNNGGNGGGGFANFGNCGGNNMGGGFGSNMGVSGGNFGPIGGGRGDDTYVIHMRGLPFSSFENDIFKFFEPLRPANVRVHYNDKNRHNGTAEAMFDTYDDAQLAMKRHRNKMGSRYIELFFNGKSTKGGNNYSSGGNNGGGGGGSMSAGVGSGNFSRRI